MRLVVIALSGLVAVTACLFPSVGDLGSQPGDGGSDGGSDGATDGCPPNSDPSLLAYYRFDEGSGTAIHDCSGNHFDGVIMASPTSGSWAVGHSGTALHVDGTTGCADFGAPAKLALTGSVTATAWVSVTQYSSLGYIVGKTTNGDTLGWRLAQDSPAPADFTLEIPGNDAGVNFAAADAKRVTSSWVHVAGTFDGAGHLAVYVGGVQLGTASGPNAILDDKNASVRIGCRGDDSSYFDGLIDEVRIYDRVLDPSELAALAK